MEIWDKPRDVSCDSWREHRFTCLLHAAHKQFRSLLISQFQRLRAIIMLAPAGSIAPVAHARNMAMAATTFDYSIPDHNASHQGTQQAIHMIKCVTTCGFSIPPATCTHAIHRHLVELVNISVNSLTSYLSAEALIRDMATINRRIIPYNPPIPTAIHPFELQMTVLSRLLHNSHDIIVATYNSLINLPFHHTLTSTSRSYITLLDAVDIVLNTIPMVPVHGSALQTVEETNFGPPNAETVARLRAQQDFLEAMYYGDPQQGVPGWREAFAESMQNIPAGTFAG